MLNSKKIILSFCFSTALLHAFDAQTLIDHLKNSIQNACDNKSKLSQDIFAIDGMSSPKVRRFLNNLCSLPSASYLEIGVWQGSTFIAALYGNTQTLSSAIAIDNWSEFDNQRGNFMRNTSLYLPQNSFKLYEHDSFTLDIHAIFSRPIDIYFYDGNHSTESQRKAFTYFNDILADTFIAVIDDWNCERVQEGTRQAFKELGYTILYEKILPGTGADRENWWNGLYVGVIQK